MAVAETPWSMIVQVEEPRLSSRGNIIGSRIRIVTVEEALDALEPVQARRLAEALVAGADRAERVDAAALPHLQRFAAAVDEFDGGEAAS